MDLNKKGSSVGVIAKGLVIKGQGKVPYTPQVATGKTTKGTISKGGMGAMLRGGTFTY